MNLTPRTPPSIRLSRNAPPMNLCLGQGYRHPQHAPVAAGCDTHGYQHNAIYDLPALAHPLIAGIEQHVGRFIQWAGTPSLQACIELLRAAAIWVEEMLILGPSSFCSTVRRNRVETPCTYISANARFIDCSERLPRSKALG